MAHNCPTCGMRHARPVQQATPNDERPIVWANVLKDVGCLVVAIPLLVALLWTFFLLWPE